MRRFLALLALLAGCAQPSPAGRTSPPNILFIAVDDLNDWIGVLGGHPQAYTPHFDRLAASGVLFTNAHCPGASCNPSRSAILTGVSPHRSGLYSNRQVMREILPDADILPQHFRKQGYWAGGAGKLLHYFIDAGSWDAYFPDKAKEDPLPRTLYPKKRPVSLPVGGPWQYAETDWGALDVDDETFGGDWLVSRWVGEQLSRTHEKPFFLSCGIYRPHEPWFVPKKYFDRFPLESIQLPPGYKEDDLDDLPPSGRERGPNRYFAHIQAHGQWKRGIQGYLASIHFADAMLGRVLDALESGPNRDNTVVVLWSDHGWQLGEKQHWQKYSAWRAVTRVPLMIRVPRGAAPGLPAGTRAGSVSDAPVNLLSLYPTLTELAGIPAKEGVDGPSLVPLLRDVDAPWGHVSTTFLADRGSFGLSSRGWRYIRYANGDEELYDIARDPYEWNNLAAAPAQAGRLAELRARAPKDFAPAPPPRVESLPVLAWHPASEGAAPPSRPDGGLFDVVFINRHGTDVELSWMDREGTPRPRGRLGLGEQKRLETRPGEVWSVSAAGKALGHFRVGDRTSRAVIPPSE